MKTLPQLLEEYVSYQSRAKTLASSSIGNYFIRLRLFFRTLGDEATTDAITILSIEAHLQALAATTLTSATSSANAIKNFCKWCKKLGYIDRERSLEFDTPKAKAQKRREMVPVEVIYKLLSACDRIPRNERYRILTRAVISLMFRSGFRINELCTLSMSDIDLATGKITTEHGKGDKIRSVFADTALPALLAWVAVRPCVCKDKAHLAEAVDITAAAQSCECSRTGPVFVHWGRRMERGAFYRLLTVVQCVAGVTNKNSKSGLYTPHQYRHAICTELLQSGVSLVNVQKFMGHASLATTEIYLHADENAQREMGKLVPLPPLKAASTQPPIPAHPQDSREKPLNQTRSKRISMRPR